MKILIPFFCLVVVSTGVWADFMSQDGKTIEDTEYRKSVENFGAQLVITNEEDVAPENLNAPSKGIYLPTTDKVQKGEIITALLAFNGCAQNENGNCQLSYKLKVLRPDGITYVDLPPDRPASGESHAGQRVGYVRLIIEPNDQTGRYTFVADVKDHVSGKLLLLKNSVVVY